MPSNNHIIVACAGGGKTTYVVEHALEQCNEKILITTYTLENLFEIRKKIIDFNGFIPENISLYSWYTLLLRDFVRPYQNILLPDTHIRSIDFISRPCRYAKRIEKRFYLNKNDEIYSDRVSDFAFHCNEKSNGLIQQRLEQIYDHIYIDEMQDLAGWDLNIVELLMDSSISITLVGDPRQNTFQTNNSQKNRRISFQQWVKKLKEKNCVEEQRNNCFRSNQIICDFADALYPKFPKTISTNRCHTKHDGVFYIKRNEVSNYIEQYQPQLLRWSIKSNTMGYKALNFGLSKGKTFERVLIFPTKPIMAYIKTEDLSKLKPKSKALLYVAVTRAKYSVTFVTD